MKKLWYSISLVVLCLLVGCGARDKNPEGAGDDMEQDFIVVGFSQVGSESVWRTKNTASIQEELTKDNGFFLNFANARQKQENQIKHIREFISQRVDYIIFSPVTEEGWETVLQEAKEAGIPVILVDRKVDVADSSLYKAWIGSDMTEEGRQAGLWLEKYEQDNQLQSQPIRIVVLQGTEGSTSTIERSKGFHQIADAHDNWEILEEPYADFTTAKGEEVMNRLLEKYATIDVLISQNDDMTFGAIQALEDHGLTTGVKGDVAVVSFDAVEEALRLVRQGKINVDIECNPLQGPYVRETLKSLERGESVEKNIFVKERVYDQSFFG